MLLSRQLRVALLISFIWHLFWLSFIRIVSLPPIYLANQYCSVYFLGSILQSPISVIQRSLPLKKAPVEVPAEFAIRLDSRQFSKTDEAVLRTARAVPSPDTFVDLDEPLKNTPKSTGLYSIAGQLQQRKLLYQPELFRYPEWTQQELKAKAALFKVYISANGLVEQSICVQASGNPEIDAALARYIEKWRFAPASGVNGQWQSVKIDLDF